MGDLDIRDMADQLVQAKLLKAQRELDAPTEREKFEFDKAKFFVNKFKEAYDAAESPMEKRHVFEQTRSWLPGLPDRVQRFVNSSFDKTPLSDSQRRILDYRSTHPEQKITANWEENPTDYIKQAFAVEEDNFQYRSFRGDKDLKRHDFVPTPEGTAYKNPVTGMVTHIDKDRRAIIENLPLLKEKNISLEQAVAIDGKIPISDFVDMKDGRRNFRGRFVEDLMTGNITTERKYTGLDTPGERQQPPKDLQDMIMLAGTDMAGLPKAAQERIQDHRLYPALQRVQTDLLTMAKSFEKETGAMGEAEKKEALKGAQLMANKTINNYLGSIFPGWHFKMVDYVPTYEEQESWLWNVVPFMFDRLPERFADTVGHHMAIWHGDPQRVTTNLIDNKTGKRITTTVFNSKGRYYDPSGKFIGSEEDAANWAATVDMPGTHLFGRPPSVPKLQMPGREGK